MKNLTLMQLLSRCECEFITVYLLDSQQGMLRKSFNPGYIDNVNWSDWTAHPEKLEVIWWKATAEHGTEISVR